MITWHKVNFSALNIEAETDRAVLIKMQHNSDYDGFKFWHPRKLIRGEGYNLTFSFTDDFEFRLFKNGQGGYNKRDIIAEETITGAEMLEQW